MRPPPADLTVDTSALVAILREEGSARGCAEVLDHAVGPIVSAANVVELLMVMEGHQGQRGVREAQDLLADLRIVSIPVDDTIVIAAHDAFRRFGKGRHRAELNYGDCFAYALARHAELPLLCIGDDFRHTDLELALR